MEEPKCLLCGQCCHFEKDGIIKKCKYLKRAGSVYLCRIYRTRLGKVVGLNNGNNVVCAERKYDVRKFKGCPYNEYFG